jgi:hypothetical protein
MHVILHFLVLDLNLDDQSVENILSVHVENLLQKLSSSVYCLSGPKVCTGNPLKTYLIISW